MIAIAHFLGGQIAFLGIVIGLMSRQTLLLTLERLYPRHRLPLILEALKYAICFSWCCCMEAVGIGTRQCRVGWSQHMWPAQRSDNASCFSTSGHHGEL